jgi:hypothetical protein
MKILKQRTIYRVFFTALLNFSCAVFPLPTLYIIGDSHASFCFTNQAQAPQHEVTTYTTINGLESVSLSVKIYPFISKTMHRFGRDGLSFINLRDIGVKEKDIVLFVFGEIDARCHIGKQHDLYNHSVSEIITTLVKNYLKSIAQNRALYQTITCLVATVPPPCDLVYNPYYPRYGQLKERIAITQHLNNTLKNICISYNMPVLDIYSLYATPSGELNTAESDGQVHVHPLHNNKAKAALFELLKKHSLV